MFLRVSFDSVENAENFKLLTGEKDLDHVNIGLINFALKAKGLVSIESVGDPIQFLVQRTPTEWDIETLINPVALAKNGVNIEPYQSRIKLMGLSQDNWSLDDGTWGQVRIANRYYPLDWPLPEFTINPLRTVEVFVMDSGINKNHSEFINAQIDDFYKCSSLETYGDDTLHGTAVASLIVGRTLGLARHAIIKNVKILSPDFKPSLMDLSEAFDAILEYHNQTPAICKVLNLSWGMPRSAYIDYKLGLLYNAGILIIASAGNTAIDIDDITPAGTSSVFTVAASTRTDQELVSIYGTEKPISIYAPGESIKCASHLDINGYNLYDGSSFSTAFTSAVAARYFVINQMQSNVTVENNMIMNSTKMALELNNKVPFYYNRLLYNVGYANLVFSQDQYIGNFVYTSLSKTPLYLSISRILGQTVGVNTAETITVNYYENSGNYISTGVVDDQLYVTLNSNFTVWPNNTNNIKIYFDITKTIPGISITTPKIYLFLTNEVLNEEELNRLVQDLDVSTSMQLVLFAKSQDPF